MLGNLLGGFIVILVGVNLIPTVANNIYAARYVNASDGTTTDSRVTGAAGTVLDLTTIFFALGIMAAGVSLAIGGLRNAGLV